MASLTDDQITIGMQVKIQEPGRQPLNGAIGTVVAIGEYDHAPVYTLALYGAEYGPFRAYDLVSVEGTQ